MLKYSNVDLFIFKWSYKPNDGLLGLVSFMLGECNGKKVFVIRHLDWLVDYSNLCLCWWAKWVLAFILSITSQFYKIKEIFGCNLKRNHMLGERGGGGQPNLYIDDLAFIFIVDCRSQRVKTCRLKITFLCCKIRRL